MEAEIYPPASQTQHVNVSRKRSWLGVIASALSLYSKTRRKCWAGSLFSLHVKNRRPRSILSLISCKSKTSLLSFELSQNYKTKLKTKAPKLGLLHPWPPLICSVLWVGVCTPHVLRVGPARKRWGGMFLCQPEAAMNKRSLLLSFSVVRLYRGLMRSMNPAS